MHSGTSTDAGGQRDPKVRSALAPGALAPTLPTRPSACQIAAHSHKTFYNLSKYSFSSSACPINNRQGLSAHGPGRRYSLAPRRSRSPLAARCITIRRISLGRTQKATATDIMQPVATVLRCGRCGSRAASCGLRDAGI
ncbi:unnamed protein product [Colias eurytheme]|nr:unnamed protein product [Colias eurytheme]